MVIQIIDGYGGGTCPPPHAKICIDNPEGYGSCLKVSGWWVEGVWKASGGCLEGALMLSGRCLQGVWKVSGRCLEGVRKVSRSNIF